MAVTLTIKHVPDELAKALRALAAKHHRSLQGELMSIIEAVVASHDAGKPSEGFQERMSADSIARPARSSSAEQGKSDALLEELDTIVADSHWGEAPILSRAQANDRDSARRPGRPDRETGNGNEK